LPRPRAGGYQTPAAARASRRGGSSRTTGVANVRFAARVVLVEVETAVGRQGRCWWEVRVVSDWGLMTVS
jgi:hypothetical protein